MAGSKKRELGHLQIMVVENNPADARLTIEAFREVGMEKGVVCLPDGDEALAYLRREDGSANKPYPHVIFLDLHLPKKSGLAVLSEIKNNPKVRAIPVVVVSGTHDPREIREAYDLHANCVVSKPSELNDFIHFIRTCYEFWGSVVTLPEVDQQ